MSKILIVCGSQSDLPLLVGLEKTLQEFLVQYEIKVWSSHRQPAMITEILDKDKLIKEKHELVIGVAISSANMPSLLAGHLKELPIPVIGVGLDKAPLAGLDSLLAISTVPKGVPILHAGIGETGLHNAALAAVRILAMTNEELRNKLLVYF